MAVAARLLRGEPLELVARETNVSMDRLTGWRDRALAGTAAALKERERDDRDGDLARLKVKVGEITMDNSLLYARIDALEQTPFGRPEAEEMSRTRSRSFARVYGLSWVTRVWDMTRATFYRSRLETPDVAPRRRPGSDPRLSGCGTGRPYPPSHRRVGFSRRGLPQAMDAPSGRRRSRQSPASAAGANMDCWQTN